MPLASRSSGSTPRSLELLQVGLHVRHVGIGEETSGPAVSKGLPEEIGRELLVGAVEKRARGIRPGHGTRPGALAVRDVRVADLEFGGDAKPPSAP